MESKLNSNLEVLLGQLEHFITTKTVVGEPMQVGDTILVPLVDVSFGVGAGGAAGVGKDDKKAASDAGAGGLGAKITPSAMLVIQNGTTQLVNVKSEDSLLKMIDKVPGLISSIPDLISKFKKPETEEDKAAQVQKEAQAEEMYHQLNQA